MTKKLPEIDKKQAFGALPLRDVVVFPHMTTTILVGRKKSIAAIEQAKAQKKMIFAITQNNPDHDNFDIKNVYETGTLCEIIELVKMPDKTVKLIIQGVIRARLTNIIKDDEAYSCEVQILVDINEPKNTSKEFIGLLKSNIENFTKLAEFNKRINQDALAVLAKLRSPYDLSNFIMTFVSADIKAKQGVLQEDEISKKLYKTLNLIKSELEIAQTESKINRTIAEKFAKSQKNFYLLEQMRQIKKELGQEDDEENEVKSLRKKISKLKLPKEVKEKCESELKKFEKMNPYASESGVIRNYLELIIELPWHKETIPNKDFKKAHNILDENHYGLEKIKDRILEFIAVQMKTKGARGPILCLVGAPGVGKTSLAKSIASALNRKYVKVSLGGVRDESEIRGHRRTYIGSMPGRMIQSMRKAKVVNPLMLLDEIDKMSYDLRGDPSSALLEVLDPEQNRNFSDHYLEVEYDLSKVMFIATANNLSGIPIPLRDRMEIINLSGYTEKEKLHIAKDYLLSKQMAENGLKKNELTISDDAILKIIRNYTFEAGVRNLEREINKMARKATKEIITKKVKQIKITEKNLQDYLSVEKYRFGVARKENMIGVATGLAYTEYGGDLLDIEALKFDGGSGKIQITGKLGDVMKESTNAALSYIRSIADELKIDVKKFEKLDFHIHVPEGATPKDGPSAGVAMCVTLASVLSKRAIKKDVAMTGEITLTGRVLAIGGLKEKLLAALRGQIKTVIIPKQNEKDLAEIPKEVLENIKIKPIETVKEALEICLA
jgi:ATP-dependent Lon protease